VNNQVHLRAQKVVDGAKSGGFRLPAETNLKKQGMLPLTFANPADYEKIAPEDQITLKITDLAPGKPVTAIVHKKGGQDVNISLNHTVWPYPSVPPCFAIWWSLVFCRTYAHVFLCEDNRIRVWLPAL
jgi:hypothetical protein